MNLGYTAEQLRDLIPMPQYLISNLQSIQTARGNINTNPEDYLTSFYGSVPQAVRELYFGYLGWYQGDPVALAPTPPVEYASRVVKLMGGRNAVLAAASEAYDKGDYQWSAELATLLVTMNPVATDGRIAKAKAFWKLAAPAATGSTLPIAATNPNWRNWYITAAMELESDPTKPKPAIVGGLNSAGIVKAVPFGDWVNQWSMRLNAQETIKNNVNTSLGIWFVPSASTEKPSGYRMTIRKAVCEIVATNNFNDVKYASNAIQITRAAADQLIDADVPHAKPNFNATLASLMQTGTLIVLNGAQQGVSDFFSTTNFDAAPERFPAIAGR
jgi:alkyl sulfatase BDS1-like metallo-beta-lactamase superfamily hydrolase